jgi:hypothetical protein
MHTAGGFGGGGCTNASCCAIKHLKNEQDAGVAADVSMQCAVPPKQKKVYKCIHMHEVLVCCKKITDAAAVLLKSTK